MAPPAPPSPFTASSPVPLRRARRPAAILGGLALVAVGGLGGMALYLQTGNRSAVLAVGRQIQAGQVITADDLAVVNISLDPALSPISAGSEPKIVGQRATTTLDPGTILVPGDLSTSPVLQTGQAVVPIDLKSGQLPASPLMPGQQIQIVYTPGAAQAAEPTTGTEPPPTTVTATVTAVGKPDSSGDVIVNVAVDADASAGLAAQASTGDIAVIITGGT